MASNFTMFAGHETPTHQDKHGSGSNVGQQSEGWPSGFQDGHTSGRLGRLATASPQSRFPFISTARVATVPPVGHKATASTPTSRVSVAIRSAQSPRVPLTVSGDMTGNDSEGHKATPVTSDLATFPAEDDVMTLSLSQNKRGRPKGWRPGMSYAQMRGRPPPAYYQPDGNASTKASKRRGRPAKSSDYPMYAWYEKTRPKFAPFKCKWHDASGVICPAELQNMETLRRHVAIVHAQDLTCRWKMCSQLNPPLAFKNEEAVIRHMRKVHYPTYLRNYGEGIKNDIVVPVKKEDQKLPAYLFDKDGNQILGSVRDQRIEGPDDYRERRRRLRALHERAEENAPDEKVHKMQILYGDMTHEELVQEMIRDQNALLNGQV